MTKPIRPEDIPDQKQSDIPDLVIETFNKLIAQHYVRGVAKVMQNDIMAAICVAFEGNYTRQEIYEKGWMDIESLFEAHGWHVDYDKPGYNETYEACFTFSKQDD